MVTQGGGGGGGARNGMVHKLLLQVFTLCSSKIELFERYFFDIISTHNDHPKHVLSSIYVFSACSRVRCSRTILCKVDLPNEGNRIVVV